MSKYTTLDDLRRSIKDLGIKVVEITILRRVKEHQDRISIPGLKVEVDGNIIRIHEVEGLSDFFCVNCDVVGIFSTNKDSIGINSSSDFILRKIKEFLKKEDDAKIDKQIDDMQISCHQNECIKPTTRLHKRIPSREEFDKKYNGVVYEQPDDLTKVYQEIDMMIDDLRNQRRDLYRGNIPLSSINAKMDVLNDLRCRMAGIKEGRS